MTVMSEGSNNCDGCVMIIMCNMNLLRNDSVFDDGDEMATMVMMVGDKDDVCLLVAYRPSNMRVYLRDGSAQTILRAATLR